MVGRRRVIGVPDVVVQQLGWPAAHRWPVSSRARFGLSGSGAADSGGWHGGSLGDGAFLQVLVGRLGLEGGEVAHAEASLLWVWCLDFGL